MSPLTKADILRGTEPVEVEIEGRGKILIRALTEGEYQMSRSIQLSAITASTNVDELTKAGTRGDDLAKMAVNLEVGKLDTVDFESKVFVVSCGLSITEKWTVDEVKAMTPPGSVEKIAKEVFRISGLGEGMDSLITSFRAKP